MKGNWREPSELEYGEEMTVLPVEREREREREREPGGRTWGEKRGSIALRNYSTPNV